MSWDWHKVPVLVQTSPGFLANRLQLALFAECLRCVEEGWPPGRDRRSCILDFWRSGFPCLTVTIADMAGLDVYASIPRLVGAALTVASFAAGPT